MPQSYAEQLLTSPAMQSYLFNKYYICVHTLSIHLYGRVFIKAFLSHHLGCLPETLNCSSSRFLYNLTPHKKFEPAYDPACTSPRVFNYSLSHGRFISAARFPVQPLCYSWMKCWFKEQNVTAGGDLLLTERR